MKIALIQINPVIGDFNYNVDKILSWVEKAKKNDCELAIFPELAVCGYPPQDLLERQSFLEDHNEALNRLIRAIKGIGVICGAITRHNEKGGKALHNSALLIENGKTIFSAHKQLLPTYDVFDEARYFEPARQNQVYDYKGLKIGLTICEDIWNDRNGNLGHPHGVNPIAKMTKNAELPIDLLINISASPFQINKTLEKQNILSGHCQKHNFHLLYINQVGGQDSLLFDGGSLAMNPRGEIIFSLPSFEEAMACFDSSNPQKTQNKTQNSSPSEKSETAKVGAGLIMGTRDYLGKCGFKSAIIGLSGGIDSALTAVIASKALGPENITGIALPSPYTSKESIDDARALADNLGINFDIIPISPLFKTFQETMAPFFSDTEPGIAEQNIQARIRGNILMAMANKFGHLLLSTGNKSEMAVGYCTLYGDMSGGLAVISDLPKMLVYELSNFFNKDQELIPWNTINKAPSAELKPDQKDEDDLPPYEILDQILAAYLEENKSTDTIIEQGFEPAMVKDVIRRVIINEYKRKQAPIGLKITSKAFGYGRRYPTAARYRN
jgi:NAD+ synthase (glutamine-hydrolysing)